MKDESGILKRIHENEKVLIQGSRQCGLTTLLLDFVCDYAIINSDSLIVIVPHSQHASRTLYDMTVENFNPEFINKKVDRFKSLALLNGTVIKIRRKSECFGSDETYPDLLVSDLSQWTCGMDKYIEQWNRTKELGLTHKIVLANTGMNTSSKPNAFLSEWYKGDFTNIVLTKENNSIKNEIAKGTYEAEYLNKIQLKGSDVDVYK